MQPNYNPERAPVPTGKHALSPSKIDALACLHRYWNEYVEPAQIRTRARHLILGQMIHKVAEMYAERLNETKLPTDWDALDSIADSVWAYPLRPFVETEYDEYKELVDRLRMLSIDHGRQRIAGVEKRLSFDGQGQPKPWDSMLTRYGGIIDLMLLNELENETYELEVIDWTTATLSALYGGKKVTQLGFYAGLVRMHYEADPLLQTEGPPERIRTRAISLRSGAEIEQTYTWDEAGGWVQRWRRESIRLEQLFEQPKENWLPAPGHYCAICTVACPLMAEAEDRMLPRVEDDDHARNVLGDVILLEEKLKLLKAILKGYTAIYGNVDVNGVAAGIFTSRGRAWDARSLDEVRDLLGQSAIDILSVVKLNKVALKKAVGKNKGLLEAIEQLGTPKVSERFGVRSAAIRGEAGEEEE